MKDEDGYFYIDEYGRKCRNEEDEINPDGFNEEFEEESEE